MNYRNLVTKRLTLKNISADDREFMLKQFSDDNVNRYLFDAEPFTCLEEADELIAFFTKPEPRAQHRWIITLTQTGEKIGTCGFHFWDRQKREMQIGYDLQSAYWQKGYGYEAMQAVIDFIKQETDAMRVDACIACENIASIKLAEKLGFEFLGKMEVLNFRGKDYPHRIYTLLLNR